MRNPVIPIALSYVAGLLLGHGFLYFPCSIITFVSLSVLVSAILIISKRLPLRGCLIIFISCAIGVGAYFHSASWLPQDHHTRSFQPDKNLHDIVGVIVSPLDREQDRTAFILDLRDIDGRPVSGRSRASVRGEVTSAGYGDTVRLSGKFFDPPGNNNPGGFDYAAYLARSNIYRMIFIRDAGEIKVVQRGAGVFRTIQDWRERIRQSLLASTSGPGSAILMAMTLGEEGQLTDELRDRFQAAGVTHIISISGSHLGMVAILCFGLIRGLMLLLPERWYHRLTLSVDPKKIAAWMTFPLLLFYTLLAGGQVATVRSLVMVSAGLFALILDREHALMHSLALAALFILIAAPQAVFDISFQLSYISVLVIAFVVALWNRLGLKPENRFQKVRNGAALLVLISLATSLATGPVVAHYFNQISFAGIVSNIVVVPFAGMVVVPLGLISGIASLFLNDLPLAGLNQAVTDAFIGIVSLFSRLPFAEFHPAAPSIPWLALYALFLISLATFLRERILARLSPLALSSRSSKAPLAGMALSGALLLALLILPLLRSRTAEISFPDVGQGDCSFVQLKSGKTVLIDGGGTHDNRFDIGRRIVAPFLWNRGVHHIDLVILSHPHGDHINGLQYILRKFSVSQVWESGRDTGLPGYDVLSQIIEGKNIPRKVVAAEDEPVKLGEAELRVLHPARKFTGKSRSINTEVNNRSLVVRMSFDDIVCLFPGDVEKKAEERLVGAARTLKCDLLKVPHHGSISSSGHDFVSLTRPTVAVVSVGKGNPFRQPSEEVIARYEKYGSRVYRTDRDGAVTVKVRRNRLDTLPWNDLILRRIDPGNRGAWRGRERENMQRLWKRIEEHVL